MSELVTDAQYLQSGKLLYIIISISKLIRDFVNMMDSTSPLAIESYWYEGRKNISRETNRIFRS